MPANGSIATKDVLRTPALAALGDRRQRLLEELAPARFHGDEERVALLELELQGLEKQLRRSMKQARAVAEDPREPGAA